MFKILSSFILMNILSANLFAQSLELRRTTTMPLESCTNNQTVEKLPLTTRYLQQIFNRLLTANQDVFKDDLDPIHLCVNPTLLRSQRAWAEPKNRSTRVEAGLVLRVQNDNQIAFVLAHELAHLAMRHTPLDGTPILPPERGIVQERIREQRALFERILSMGKHGPKEERDRIHAEHETVANQVKEALVNYFGEEAAVNWSETEADEIGSIYFLRAGFDIREIGWRQDQLAIGLQAAGLDPRYVTQGENYDAHGAPPLISSFERRKLAEQACGFAADLGQWSEPRRGFYRYPMPCWQIWNLRQRLPRTHEVFSQLFQILTGPMTEITSPSLEQVKTEIRAQMLPR